MSGRDEGGSGGVRGEELVTSTPTSVIRSVPQCRRGVADQPLNLSLPVDTALLHSSSSTSTSTSAFLAQAHHSHSRDQRLVRPGVVGERVRYVVYIYFVC
jgi:hypothetical protein